MKKPHSDSNPQPAAPASADAEQAARLLGRLAEMAMEQAEAMHRATMAAIEADDAAKTKEFGLAFERAGRGVSRMLALKLHLARKRQEMAEKAETHARDQAAAKETRRNRVARAVACSVAANRDLDVESCEAQIAAMWKRLVDDPEIDACHLCQSPARQAFHSPPPLAGGGKGEGSARVRANAQGTELAVRAGLRQSGPAQAERTPSPFPPPARGGGGSKAKPAIRGERRHKTGCDFPASPS